MCGIFGYLGKRNASPIIVEGLKGLEYRGYDSAGIATIHRDHLDLRKTAGKVDVLKKLIQEKPMEGTVGVGHTRWATHGEPTDLNSHPQLDCKKQLCVIHNGIIENYVQIKEELLSEGHCFISDTDTEVIAHLIEKFYTDNNFEEAVLQAIRKLKGAYAIGVIHINHPDQIIVARKGSPLLIGFGKNEYFIASDIAPILKYTKKVVYLDDFQLANIQRGYVVFKNGDGELVKKTPIEVDMEIEVAEKEGFDYFMMKEIFEQPRAISDTLAGRYDAEKGEIFFYKLTMSNRELLNINRIVITACGTSLNAGLIGEFFLEKFANVPVEVEFAAEFRYRNPIIDHRTLVLAISQSGETADTIAAVIEAKNKGAMVLSICNVVNSTITRESHGVIYTRAGIEIGVASTKAFSTQIIALYMFALYLGQIKWSIEPKELIERLKELIALPHRIQQELLDDHDEIKRIARKYHQTRNFLYLGRGIGFPVAMEGALKMKEISYIHAEGYSAAEMKHGPIALIDEDMPVVVIATQHRAYEKILSNISEVKARKGKVIAVATKGDKKIKEFVDDVIYIPDSSEELGAILEVIPLQLLAYYSAVLRGCHIDQPRNLAKSVTVE